MKCILFFFVSGKQLQVEDIDHVNRSLKDPNNQTKTTSEQLEEPNSINNFIEKNLFELLKKKQKKNIIVTKCLEGEV